MSRSAFYPTTTKEGATRPISRRCAGGRDEVVPCVAIGGIKIENASPLIEAGADSLPCRRVYGHEATGSGRQSFNALFAKDPSMKNASVRSRRRSRSTHSLRWTLHATAMDTTDGYKGLTFSVRPTCPRRFANCSWSSYPRRNPATPCRKAAHSAQVVEAASVPPWRQAGNRSRAAASSPSGAAIPPEFLRRLYQASRTPARAPTRRR